MPRYQVTIAVPVRVRVTAESPNNAAKLGIEAATNSLRDRLALPRSRGATFSKQPPTVLYVDRDE